MKKIFTGMLYEYYKKLNFSFLNYDELKIPEVNKIKGRYSGIALQQLDNKRIAKLKKASWYHQRAIGLFGHTIFPDMILQKGRKQYLVEVKAVNTSHALERALGQLILYQALLKNKLPNMLFVLMMPRSKNDFSKKFLDLLKNKYGIVVITFEYKTNKKSKMIGKEKYDFYYSKITSIDAL